MAKKKQSHTGFRNGELFCFNCGTSYDMHYPQPISIAAAIFKQFDKDHKNCPKIWTEPVNTGAESKSIDENINWWLQYGEHGISSKTMVKNMYLNRFPRSWNELYGVKFDNECHPSDPDDFNRCYKLLESVPQLKSELNLMRISTQWAALVDNWDKLTELLEEQIKIGKPNGMYELMKEIGC